MPLLNNENSTPKNTQDGAGCSVEKSPRPYDLWRSDSLFPCWNDLNGLIPENITAPHPSELPLPSPKLKLGSRNGPLDSGFRNEVEATSTTDENVLDDFDCDDGKTNTSKSKVMS